MLPSTSRCSLNRNNFFSNLLYFILEMLQNFDFIRIIKKHKIKKSFKFNTCIILALILLIPPNPS